MAKEKKKIPRISIIHGISSQLSVHFDFKKLQFRGTYNESSKTVISKSLKSKKIIFLVRDPRDIVVSLFHGSRTRDLVYDGSDISVFIRDKNCGFPKIIKFMNIWANEIKKGETDLLPLLSLLIYL